MFVGPGVLLLLLLLLFLRYQDGFYPFFCCRVHTRTSCAGERFKGDSPLSRFRRRRPVASLRSLFIFTLYRFCLTTHAGMRGSPVLYHHDRSEDLTQTSRHYLSLTNFPGQRLPMNYCYWSYPLTAIFETLKQPKNLNYGFQNTPNL